MDRQRSSLEMRTHNAYAWSREARSGLDTYPDKCFPASHHRLASHGSQHEHSRERPTSYGSIRHVRPRAVISSYRSDHTAYIEGSIRRTSLRSGIQEREISRTSSHTQSERQSYSERHGYSESQPYLYSERYTTVPDSYTYNKIDSLAISLEFVTFGSRSGPWPISQLLTASADPSLLEATGRCSDEWAGPFEPERFSQHFTASAAHSGTTIRRLDRWVGYLDGGPSGGSCAWTDGHSGGRLGASSGGWSSELPDGSENQSAVSTTDHVIESDAASGFATGADATHEFGKANNTEDVTGDSTCAPELQNSPQEHSEVQHRCFVLGCNVTQPFISHLLRHAEKCHDFFYCNDCCNGFSSLAVKTGYLSQCEFACMSPDCHQYSTTLNTNDVLRQRHKRTAECPTVRKVDSGHKLDYLKCLYRSVHTDTSLEPERSVKLFVRPKGRPKAKSQQPSGTSQTPTTAKVCKPFQKPEVPDRSQTNRETRLLNIIRYLTSKTGIDPFLRSSLELDAPELLAEHNESMRAANGHIGPGRILQITGSNLAPPDTVMPQFNDGMGDVHLEMTRTGAQLGIHMTQSPDMSKEMPSAVVEAETYPAWSKEQEEQIESLVREMQEEGTYMYPLD